MTAQEELNKIQILLDVINSLMVPKEARILAGEQLVAILKNSK